MVMKYTLAVFGTYLTHVVIIMRYVHVVVILEVVTKFPVVNFQQCVGAHMFV